MSSDEHRGRVPEGARAREESEREFPQSRLGHQRLRDHADGLHCLERAGKVTVEQAYVTAERAENEAFLTQLNVRRRDFNGLESNTLRWLFKHPLVNGQLLFSENTF